MLIELLSLKLLLLLLPSPAPYSSPSFRSLSLFARFNVPFTVGVQIIVGPFRCLFVCLFVCFTLSLSLSLSLFRPITIAAREKPKQNDNKTKQEKEYPTNQTQQIDTKNT